MADAERDHDQVPDAEQVPPVGSVATPTSEAGETPNKRALGLTLAGALLLIVVAAEPGWFHLKSWPSVVEAFLVEFATGLIVAAILVYLEPRFTKKVQDTVEQVAENAAESAAKEVRPVMNEVADLRQRVETLTERTANLIGTRDKQTDQALEALTKTQSFETITRVLEAANDLNALADGIATVQGGTDPADEAVDLENPLSIRVRFLWGSHPAAPQPALVVQAVCDQDQYIVAKQLMTQEPKRDNNDSLCAKMEWVPTDSAESVGAQLVEALRGEGLYQGEKTLNWGVAISELQRTIGVAVAARRGDTRWPVAPLFELVGDDWAITRMGVEYKYGEEFGPVFEPDNFWAIYPGGRNYRNPGEGPPLRNLPPGVSRPSDRLRIRAEAYLPLRKSPNTPPGWTAVRSGMQRQAPGNGPLPTANGRS